MKIAYGTRYCTCAGINSWLRYLIAATRRKTSWGLWYTKGYAVAQEDMRLFADVNFGSDDFRDYLRLFGPDITMVTYGPPMCHKAYKYREESGTPVVVILHGIEDYNPKMAGILNRADVVIVPSETMKKDFGSWDVLEEDNLRLIHHGVIDFSPLNVAPYNFREEFGIPDDHAIVGWAGRIDSEKGWSMAREVVDKSESLPVSFIVAGVGKPSYTGRFIQEVEDRDNLYWAQTIPINSMPAFYEAIDIGLSTSPYESFGLAVCEMGMASLPVVAKSCGAIREVLGDKAVLVEDADGGVNGIMSLLERDRRVDMGRRLRMRMFGKKFTAERMGDDYLELWGELLEE